MKVLVYGGSFNPVHNGHINLLIAAKELVQPDVTLIIPTYMPVHKRVGADFLSGEHRVKMCKLAFEKYGAIVSDIEVAQKKPCYMYDTLLKLKAEYNNADLYLACGTDMVVTLDEWYNYLGIYELATICAVSRDDSERASMLKYINEQEPKGMKCLVSTADAVDISSSEIRQMIKEGKSISDYVPESIENFILSNNLYR